MGSFPRVQAYIRKAVKRHEFSRQARDEAARMILGLLEKMELKDAGFQRRLEAHLANRTLDGTTEQVTLRFVVDSVLSEKGPRPRRFDSKTEPIGDRDLSETQYSNRSRKVTDPALIVENDEFDRVMRIALEDAISGLSEPQQTILRRVSLLEQTQVSVAKQLDLPLSTLNDHLRKASKALAARLAIHREDYNLRH